MAEVGGKRCAQLQVQRGREWLFGWTPLGFGCPNAARGQPSILRRVVIWQGGHEGVCLSAPQCSQLTLVWLASASLMFASCGVRSGGGLEAGVGMPRAGE